jgi:hypothetical protein
MTKILFRLLAFTFINITLFAMEQGILEQPVSEENLLAHIKNIAQLPQERISDSYIERVASFLNTIGVEQALFLYPELENLLQQNKLSRFLYALANSVSHVRAPLEPCFQQAKPVEWHPFLSFDTQTRELSFIDFSTKKMVKLEAGELIKLNNNQLNIMFVGLSSSNNKHIIIVISNGEDHELIFLDSTIGKRIKKNSFYRKGKILKVVPLDDVNYLFSFDHTAEPSFMTFSYNTTTKMLTECKQLCRDIVKVGPGKVAIAEYGGRISLVDANTRATLVQAQSTAESLSHLGANGLALIGPEGVQFLDTITGTIGAVLEPTPLSHPVLVNNYTLAVVSRGARPGLLILNLLSKAVQERIPVPEGIGAVVKVDDFTIAILTYALKLYHINLKEALSQQVDSVRTLKEKFPRLQEVFDKPLLTARGFTAGNNHAGDALLALLKKLALAQDQNEQEVVKQLAQLAIFDEKQSIDDLHIFTLLKRISLLGKPILEKVLRLAFCATWDSLNEEDYREFAQACDYGCFPLKTSDGKIFFLDSQLRSVSPYLERLFETTMRERQGQFVVLGQTNSILFKRLKDFVIDYLVMPERISGRKYKSLNITELLGLVKYADELLVPGESLRLLLTNLSGHPQDELSRMAESSEASNRTYFAGSIPFTWQNLLVEIDARHTAHLRRFFQGNLKADVLSFLKSFLPQNIKIAPLGEIIEALEEIQQRWPFLDIKTETQNFLLTEIGQRPFNGDRGDLSDLLNFYKGIQN